MPQDLILEMKIDFIIYSDRNQSFARYYQKACTEWNKHCLYFPSPRRTLRMRLYLRHLMRNSMLIWQNK